MFNDLTRNVARGFSKLTELDLRKDNGWRPKPYIRRRSKRSKEIAKSLVRLSKKKIRRAIEKLK